MTVMALRKRLSALEQSAAERKLDAREAAESQMVEQYMRIVGYHLGDQQPNEHYVKAFIRALDLNNRELDNIWSDTIDAVNRLCASTGKSVAELDAEAMQATPGQFEHSLSRRQPLEALP